MERACHINLAMTGDIGVNGKAGSEVAMALNHNKQPCGSVVSFHNIQYKVKIKSGFFWKRKISHKEILSDLNGIMRPGLNAILGPTGSGKSSLLDILAARKDPAGFSGEVLIDNAPQPPNFKFLAGYVVQDDVVMGTLTVIENLHFSAALRLPSSVSQHEKGARVNHLIKELGLTKVADSKVGTPIFRGISGGERKRTTIGMELIMDPSVLFLDEPTTGLDASTAHSVLLLLKRMATHGRTIIMSIHQPRYSIYRLFDTLTMLAAGKMVYHGPAPSALDYFTNMGYICEPHNNPADFFLDVINGNNVASTLTKRHGCEVYSDPPDLDYEKVISSRQSIQEHLVEEYRNSSYFRDTGAELDSIDQAKSTVSYPTSHAITYNCSFFHQLYWVLKRTFWDLLLNPQLSVAQLVVHAFLALIVGAIFFGVKDDHSGLQNRMGVFFFITTNQCFTTVSSAELFITQRKLFLHENISGYYRVSVYFLSKIMSDISLRTFTSVTFSCVIYFIVGLKHTPAAFFTFVLTVTLVTLTAFSVAMAISANQDVVSLATIYITITFVFMMIFSGLLVNLPNMMKWISWLKYFSIPRYGLAALQANEFVGLKLCNETLIQNSNLMALLATGNLSTVGLICTGEQHLNDLEIGYTTWGLWVNNLVLLIMMCTYLLIAYLKLRYIKKFT